MRTVRPDTVVVAAPPLDEQLVRRAISPLDCLLFHLTLEAVEDPAVEELVSEFAVEALVIAVLPRRSRAFKSLNYRLEPVKGGRSMH